MKEHIPYRSIKGENIDFERKRFRFWLETVPIDIRKMEYDLWREYRTLFQINKFQWENAQGAGRHRVIPSYPPGQKEIDWHTFSLSFLFGEDRKDRFREIIQEVKSDLPKIFYTFKEIVEQDIDIAALSGSSVYGPRKVGEFLSDIDVCFLHNSKDKIKTLEIMADKSLKVLGKPYHLLTTGAEDETRGTHADIHWLLYPHVPLFNRLEDDKLKEIIKNLVDETHARMDQLDFKLHELRDTIDKQKEGIHLG